MFKFIDKLYFIYKSIIKYSISKFYIFDIENTLNINPGGGGYTIILIQLWKLTCVIIKCKQFVILFLFLLLRITYGSKEKKNKNIKTYNVRTSSFVESA